MIKLIIIFVNKSIFKNNKRFKDNRLLNGKAFIKFRIVTNKRKIKFNYN